MAESLVQPGATSPLPRHAFAPVARGVTVATVLVVLLGAIVRITGSGAGCGQHWPTCNGEVAHLPRRLETWIELSPAWIFWACSGSQCWRSNCELVIRPVRPPSLPWP